MQSPQGSYNLASLIGAFLTFSRIALGFCLIVFFLLLLATSTGLLQGESPSIRVTMPVTFKLTGPIEQLASPASARLENVHGNLVFPARTGTFLTVHLLIGILAVGFLLWGVAQLSAIFGSLRHGIVFIPENANRIRRVGWMVIAGECIRAAMGLWWSYYGSANFKANGVQFVTEMDLNATPIVCGLVILVVAQVFREGVRLIDEQSLTI